MKKFLFGLAPLLAVAASGLGVLASSASASAPCTVNVLCNGSNAALRDDAVVPPTGGQYGSSALAVNTHGPLRLTALGSFNENPTGYAFFGIKLHSDPATSTAHCEKATGWVLFVDIQNAKKNGGGFSPVYDNTSPAPGNGPWPFNVKSDNTGCLAAERGVVTIEKVALFFPNLATGNITVTGNLKAKWVQPGSTSTCPAGGIGLKEKQTETKINGVAVETEITGGAAGEGFICFVSANNNLWPETAPTWSPFKDEAGSATPGIWKD
jgi:hypothetical protein